MRKAFTIGTMAALALVFVACVFPSPARAQLSDTELYDFSQDAQGWILQLAERHHDQSGQDVVLNYLPFSPEGWDDGTSYPFGPGSDPFDGIIGAFGLGLRLEGVWDGVNAAHRWTDAAYLQSEDSYTHLQAGWPEGYEQHPDYAGAWAYGHYASIGAVTGDYLSLRVYQPGFTHGNDPVQGRLYTRSGAGSTLTESAAYSLEHGWNVLRLPVSAIADPTDLREVGVKVASTHPVWGDAYVDEVRLGSTEFDGERFVYLTPDVAWFSEQPGYDTRRVKVYYDDGGATLPGVRGFSIVIHYPAGVAKVTSVTPGTLLAPFQNHFEYEIDNVAGTVQFDWVIMGVTSGASGFGSLAEITFDAADGHAGDDGCGVLDLAETECRLRDPDNLPLTASFADGRVSHDILPPADPVLASPTHTEGGLSGQNDVCVTWATTADGGACPAGVRGYYLLLDQDPLGVPDPGTSQYSWFTPWAPDSAGYAHWFADVGDGAWYVHIIGYDYLWNATQVDTYGPLSVDTVPPENVTALDADVTDNADLSTELVWTNPISDFTGVRIYRKGFGFYPEYDDDGGFIPPWPASPADALAHGWVMIYDGTGTSFVDHPAVRDYYYYAAFAYDVVYNYALATPGSRDASLCYWLGDFTVGGPFVVDIMDVLVLSLAYYEAEGDPAYNPICDIGPTTDYYRKSRPTTDNVIEFEDLILLALNYENAQLTVPPVTEPCTGTMTAGVRLETAGGEVIARIELGGNPGCLQGASVELGYGSDLEFIGATAGGIWSGSPSFFRATPREGRRIALDAATLGRTIGADGGHAVVRFRRPNGASAAGTDPAGLASAVTIERFRARGPGNIDLTGGTWTQAVEDGAVSVAAPARLSVLPNPATHGATVAYEMARPGRVALRLFDASGRLLRLLVDEAQVGGRHQLVWDGRLAGGAIAAPGVYFFRLEANGVSGTQKLLVVR